MYIERANINNHFKLLGLSLLGLLCMGGIVFLQTPKLRENPQQLTKKFFQEQDQQRQIRLNLIRKTPSFGFDNLIANWVFLDFIQYYGDFIARDKIGHILCPDYFRLIVDRDPRFIRAYLFLAPATSLFAGRPDLSVAFMTQGLKYINPKQPLSYQVWTYKAIDQLLFLGDTEGAKRSYQMAAQWASQFPDQTSQYIATSSAQTAQFLSTNPDSTRVRVSAWAMIFGNSRDQQTRDLARKNIEGLGGKIIITPTTLTVKMPPEKKK